MQRARDVRRAGSGQPDVQDRAAAAAGPVGLGIYALVLCGLVMVVAGLIGLGLHQPWLFPSLGPTLMIFFETPKSAAARPRDALVGHGVALLAGLVALEVFGLRGHPSAVVEGLTLSRVLAAALALGLTTFVLSSLKAPHPPAGATTLIVALGILTSNSQLGTMALAIVFVTVFGLLLNRLLGARQPVW